MSKNRIRVGGRALAKSENRRLQQRGCFFDDDIEDLLQLRISVPQHQDIEDHGVQEAECFPREICPKND